MITVKNDKFNFAAFLAIIVYTVVGYLAHIYPTIINQIDIIVIHASVDHGYHYVKAASKDIPRLSSKPNLAYRGDLKGYKSLQWACYSEFFGCATNKVCLK